MPVIPKPPKAPKADWTPPRTPWGDPDISGNFTNKYEQGTPMEKPAGSTLKLVERFTRTAPDIVEWTVTVDDPLTWVRPWTFSLPLTVADHEPVMEYACHEGNYAMSNMLSGARADERTSK